MWLSKRIIYNYKKENFIACRLGFLPQLDKQNNNVWHVLAQGGNPIIPKLNGIDGQNIFTVRTLKDADKIKEYISKNEVRTAVVIGAGFIGIEMAENLVHLGIETKVVELADQILTPVDYEVACFAQNEMRANGVELILSDGVKSFSATKIELNSGLQIDYDMAMASQGSSSSLGVCGFDSSSSTTSTVHLQFGCGRSGTSS